MASTEENEKNIKISIIMPVYNAAQYLEESVSSLRRQTMQDIEILCIDDGSTDDSFLMLEHFAKEDARIRVFHFKENRSTGYARYFGIKAACGEYLLFADADDTLISEACEELYREITNAGVDILHFSTDVVDVKRMSQSYVNQLRNWLRPYIGFLYGEEIFTACFREKKYNFTLWNKIYRTEICKKAMQGVEAPNLPRGSDKLLYLMIAYVADSYKGIVGKCYYLYHRGRGVSGEEELSIDKFVRYCQMVESGKLVKNFLCLHHVENLYMDIVKDYQDGLVSDCVGNW